MKVIVTSKFWLVLRLTIYLSIIATTLIFVMLAVVPQTAFATDPSKTDLSNVNWDDEVPAEDDAAAHDSSNSMKEDGIREIELMEKKVHISGFLLFSIYLLGVVLTAYFTRNRKIAVDFPPELLILLHTLWPLELVLALFMGRKVR